MAQAEQADILVVGAGMAGLYFSWRMLKERPNVKITMLETQGRTGGRLHTDIVPINGVLVKNEEGGMRFTAGMLNLMGLIKTLGLGADVMPFSMGDDHNIYQLRGRRFTFGQMNADPSLWSTIYNLREAERNRQPNAMLQDVVNAVLEQNGITPGSWYPQTPEDWQRVRLTFTYRGIALYQWGFWALLVDYGLSQECLQMIEDSMGFLAFYDQKVNAGVGFQTMGDFDKLPDYLTLRSGYETLAETLTGQVRAMGGNILLGQQVESFDQDRSNPALLTVRARASSGMVEDFSCKQIVLALPSRPLKQLARRSPLTQGNAQLMSDIASVTSMPLTKINLYFEQRWWFDRFQLSAGGSFTDLPMAQFYCYWPMDPNQQQGPASMTIYCDFDRTSYWEELQGIGTAFAPAPGLSQPVNSTAASSFVVEQAMRQLREFFGTGDLPGPVLSTYVRWGTDQFGDGDHSWLVHADDKAIMQRLQNPIAGKVFTCGEAYSDEQAWVDGALRSTDALLQSCFGLPAYNAA